jgi:OmpR-family two-component system manganese-sensing response regulator
LSKLLVVEDESSTQELIVDALKSANYVVDAVSNAADARAYIQSVHYDALVLDWQLPDGSGLEICSWLRSEGNTVPVIMLTARTKIGDKIDGLDSGADDYLTKPFDARELLARVAALLRRPAQTYVKVVSARGIALDFINHIAHRDGADLNLNRKEFALLELFMRNPGRVFSTDDLAGRVWSTESDASVETIRQTILRLRQKIEIDSQNPLIRTIRGVGYRFEA